MATFSWISAAILVAFIFLTQLGMMLSLVCGRAAMAWIAPLSLGVAVSLGYFAAKRTGLVNGKRWVPIVLAVGVIIGALGISACYYDLSWDGQWYHQVAIYGIAQDWNPLSDPMRAFPEDMMLWVRHYAKGTWYVAAAIYQTTGLIECGKAVNFIAWAVMAFSVFGAALDYGMQRGRAAALAVIVSLNPIVLSVFATFLVDGVLVSYLTATIAAVMSVSRRPQLLVALVGIGAAIGCINAKLTGLVFIGFVFAAAGLWFASRRRSWLPAYLAVALLTLAVGVAGFGYNPYVTNLIHRHQPFYPVLGSKAFPSLTQQGKEGIELYETPKNLLGRNRLVRLGYSIFGRPGNAPYIKQRDAVLMWPFAARPADLVYYKYHETRMAGFGPWFSGALVVSAVFGFFLFLRRGFPRAAVGLITVTIVGSLLFSPHLWWPRYGPQLWFLAIVPVMAVFATETSRRVVAGASALLVLLAINAAIVGAVHLNWETRASNRLREQLTELQKLDTPVEINFRWFGKSVEERFKTWGIPYVKKSAKELRTSPMLMSVVDGYPGEIHYRIPVQKNADRPDVPVHPTRPVD